MPSMLTIFLIVLFVALIGAAIFTAVRSGSPSAPDTQSCQDAPTATSSDNKKVKAFEEYLKTKLHKAISDAMTTYDKEATGAIAIYMKNTPFNTGPVRAWGAACGGTGTGECEYAAGGSSEPAFYFGSGTKPITATLVASQLYKLWRFKNKDAPPEQFIDWYAGKPNKNGLRGENAVTYEELYTMTSGFKGSEYTETLVRASNTESESSGKQSYTQSLQDWLYCCPTGGMTTTCPAGTSLFCDNSCDKICPEPLSASFVKGKCPHSPPLCPDDLCSWAWCNPNATYTSLRDPNTYSKPTCSDGKITAKDPNGEAAWVSGEWCSCPVIQPSEYAEIFKALSPYSVAMMRSGIPDSDSIWAIDNAAQLASRTHSIGPIEFVGEIIGFDWDPRWKNGAPVTAASTPYLSEDSVNPAAMYSSSAYSFLGVLLWLLNDSNGRKEWSDIDLNAMLPEALYCKLNFAGTKGRGNDKYFRKNAYGDSYYSYEETVKQGGVAHSPENDTMMGTKQTSLEKAVNESYTPLSTSQAEMRHRKTRQITTEAAGSDGTKIDPVYPHINRDGKVVKFVDWDASSGVMDGNSWGHCTGMAEIYMNIFSPTAENPLMPAEVQGAYVEEFLDYNGVNWKALYNNQIRAPFCLGGSAWSQGGTYNCGAMGPDWFVIYDEPTSEDTYGMIPCFGHLGDTYGSVSGHLYVPGGELRPYQPYASNIETYSTPEWSMSFQFSGGLEFTLSQAINDGDDQTTALQNFIADVIKDPFDWSV